MNAALRSRWVLSIAVLLLAGIGLMWWVPNSGPAPHTMLPPGETALVHVDMAQLRRAGILNKIAGSPVDEELEYRRFVEATGFDYKQNLDAVDGGFYDDSVYFVLKGTFDLNRLASYAKSSGGSCAGEICRMVGSAPNRLISFTRLGRGRLGLAVSESDPIAVGRLTETSTVREGLPGDPVWLLVAGEHLQEFPLTAWMSGGLPPVDQARVTAGTSGIRLELAVKKASDAGLVAAGLRRIIGNAQSGKARARNESVEAPGLGDLLASGQVIEQGPLVSALWPLPAGWR